MASKAEKLDRHRVEKLETDDGNVEAVHDGVGDDIPIAKDGVQDDLEGAR